MAKLSTPYHDCQAPMINAVTGLPMACKRPAYRRHGPGWDGGRWLCKPHTQMARAREAWQEKETRS